MAKEKKWRLSVCVFLPFLTFFSRLFSPPSIFLSVFSHEFSFAVTSFQNFSALPASVATPGGFHTAWGRRRFSATSKYRSYSVKSTGHAIVTSKSFLAWIFPTSKKLRASEKVLSVSGYFSVIIAYRFFPDVLICTTSSLHATNINNVRFSDF